MVLVGVFHIRLEQINREHPEQYFLGSSIFLNRSGIVDEDLVLIQRVSLAGVYLVASLKIEFFELFLGELLSDELIEDVQYVERVVDFGVEVKLGEYVVDTLLQNGHIPGDHVDIDDGLFVSGESGEDFDLNVVISEILQELLFGLLLHRGELKGCDLGFSGEDLHFGVIFLDEVVEDEIGEPILDFETDVLDEVDVEKSLLVLFIDMFLNSLNELPQHVPLDLHFFFIEVVERLHNLLVVSSLDDESSQLLSSSHFTVGQLIGDSGHDRGVFLRQNVHNVGFCIISHDIHLVFLELVLDLPDEDRLRVGEFKGRGQAH